MTASTDRKITISGIEFTVPQPYAPGTIELTAGEASALNQVLGENLRNNFAAVIRKTMDEYRKANQLEADAEVPVTSLDIDQLRSDFAEYAANYEFGVRGTGTRSAPVDPVLRKANEIAWAKIKDSLKKKNVKITSISEEQKDSYISQVLAKYPAIMEEARRQVDAVATLALDELA